MAYDASNGFHDLKPLPLFNPWPANSILAVAAILCLLLAAIWYLYRRKHPESHKHSAPPLPPEVEALTEIRRLGQLREDNAILIRDLAQRLSLALRVYLEKVLYFPASDQTPKEVNLVLGEKLKKKLPTVPKELLDELQSGLNSTLRFCEQAAFSPRSEVFYPLDSQALLNHLRQAEKSVQQLAHWGKKEEERMSGVIAKSRLGENKILQGNKGS